MKTFLMMLLGFASGAIVAAGIFAFITVIGIIPRMAQRTGTEAYCRHYEDMITLGGLFGCLPMLTDLHVSAPPLVLGFIGAAVGIFVGVLAVSLAEVLNVVPVFLGRAHLKQGLSIFVLAFALGKTMRALLCFLVPYLV